MANRRFIDFPVATTVGANDIILIWQDGLNKQTTKATILSGLPEDLEDLADVNISGLTNGQILRYDSTTGKWINTDQANLDLSDLNDVSIVSPSNGQVLVYNSSTSKWENSSAGFVPYIGAVTTVDLGAQQLKAGHGTFATNGSTETLTVNHTSGSGVGVNITKGGNNEGLRVNKTSGSGNAATIIGTLEATTLVKTGGTSAQFLKADGSVDSTAYVPTSRQVIAGAGLAGGGALTSNVTLSHADTSSQASVDNSNGNVIQDITLDTYGHITALGSTNLDSRYYTESEIDATLTNYQLLSAKGQPNGYAGLDSNGKVPLAQINDALIGNVNFQGLWNAATNTPTLANPPAAGTKGYYYIVSTAGTFAGISFEVGDWIISDGSAWGKVDNTDAVSSVFGRTGNVTASNGDYNTSQVTESGNLYFTNARAIASVLTGYTSGAGTISAADTIISAIQKLNGNIGALTTTNIAEGTNLYYTEARVNANANVAANTAARHAAVTLGTANGLSLNVQQLSLGLASAGVTGALSGTDWSTFNNKQNALTNPVTGTGLTNRVAKFNSNGSTITYGLISDDGASIETNAFTFITKTLIPRQAVSYATNFKDLIANTGGWIYLGNLVMAQGGVDACITMQAGVGFNASLSQMGHAKIHIRTSNGAPNGAGFYFSAYSENFGYNNVFSDIRITENISTNTLGIYVYVVQFVAKGYYKVEGSNIEYIPVETAAAPPSTYYQVPRQFTVNSYTVINDSLSVNGPLDAYASTFSGDVRVYRGATPTTGFLFFGSTGTNYIGYDGAAFFVNGNLNATSFIKTGGTSAQFLKADGSVDSTAYGTGSVTSVAALTLGTSGTDLSSTVANGTTTPVITLNVPTASAANRGALSAADWTTFNNKQQALNGTGFVKITGTTISYDNTNYLALTGGTLTGALNGTIATFLSGSSSTIGLIVGGAGGAGSTRQGQLRFGDAGSVYKIQGGEDYSAFNFMIGAGTPLSIASNAAATFASSVQTGGNVLVPAGSGLAWSGDASRIMTPEDNVFGALIQTPGGIKFNAGGTSPRMTILATGNVGIGTINPLAKATVRGGNLGNSVTMASSVFSVQANDQGIFMGSFNGTPNFGSWIQAGREAFDIPFVLSLQPNGGNVGIGTANPSLSNLVISPSLSTGTVDGLTVIYHPDGASTRLRAKLWINDFNGQLDLKDSADNQTIKISAGGASYFNGGNVGIGTPTPTDKLQMNGGKAIFATSNFNGTTAGGSVFVFSDDDNGGKIWAQKDGNQAWGYLALQPAGGNVLIGTSTSIGSSILQVTGDARISNVLLAGGAANIDSSLAVQISSTGSGTQKWFAANKNGGYGLIVGYSETTGLSGVGAYIRQVTSDPLFFVVNNTTTALTLDSTGAATFSNQVGFGTGLYIDTNGDLYQPVTGRVFISAAAANVTFPSYGFYNDTGLGMYRESTDTLAFATSGVKALTLASNQAAFFSSSVDINGKTTITADAGNEQLLIRRASNTNEQLIIGYHSSDYARIQAVEQGVAYRPLALQQDGGNVLIGTTDNPGFTVNVNGTLRTTGIITADKGISYQGGIINVTGASASWINLGTISIAQGGDTAVITIEGGSGYNADNGQNASARIFIRTSNGSPNGSGWFFSAYLTQTGYNASMITDCIISQVNSTTYTVYVNFGAYSGNTYYKIEGSSYGWTASNSNHGATAPTGFTLPKIFNVISPATFSSSVTVGGVITATNNGVDGNYLDAFIARYSANNNEQNAIQTAVSSAPEQSGFRFQVSNGAGSAGRSLVSEFRRDRQIFYGNVGIGTASPTNKLHINSTDDNAYALRVQGNTNNEANVWTGIGIAGEGANTKAAILFQDIGQSFSRGRLLFCVNNNADQSIATPDNAVMTLTNDGNVLIGTTTDNGHKLQLSSASTSKTTFSINNTSANKTYEIGVQGSSGTLPNRFYIFDDDRNAFLFSITSGGTSRFHAALETLELSSETTTKLATISGNVLVGTTTDTSDKLRVNGNTFTNTIRTHTPDLETRSVAWKLGASRGGTVTTNATVRVEIDGVLVDLVARYV